MGFFNDIMEGFFGEDDEANAAFPEELKALLDFGLGQGQANAGMGTSGFNMAETLMPLLFEELGITTVKDKDGNVTGFEKTPSQNEMLQPLLLEEMGIKAVMDKDGKITGYERIADPNQAAKDKLEATTLKNLNMYAEGRGAVPVGVSERNKAARQNLRGGLRRAGFQRGDTPFDMAMNKLKTGIRETNDAFRHGQFGVAANLLNQMESDQRADMASTFGNYGSLFAGNRGELGQFLMGATGAQQSPLPWLQSLVQNNAAMSGYASAGVGGGIKDGESGLFGQMFGGALAHPDKAMMALKYASMCWVARAVYGDTNPDWLLFRRWLIVKSPLWFWRTYVIAGPSLGRLIRTCPVIGKMLKPFMDRAL